MNVPCKSQMTKCFAVISFFLNLSMNSLVQITHVEIGKNKRACINPRTCIVCCKYMSLSLKLRLQVIM